MPATKKNIVRDLKTGYQLVKQHTDDVSSVSMVIFVAQKPNPEDVQMIGTLKRLGMKITVVALGNNAGVDEWLSVDDTVLMRGRKNIGDNIDQVVDQAKQGSLIIVVIVMSICKLEKD